jgi:hypothetical protein
VIFVSFRALIDKCPDIISQLCQGRIKATFETIEDDLLNTVEQMFTSHRQHHGVPAGPHRTIAADEETQFADTHLAESG